MKRKPDKKYTLASLKTNIARYRRNFKLLLSSVGKKNKKSN